MEPLFFKAENLCTDRLLAVASLRFNGAAFFQSGKSVLLHRIAFPKGASMEPLFFKAENNRPYWEMGVLAWASMEPLFFKAENAPRPGVFLAS